MLVGEGSVEGTPNLLPERDQSREVQVNDDERKKAEAQSREGKGW